MQVGIQPAWSWDEAGQRQKRYITQASQPPLTPNFFGYRMMQ
jgi:hypothetical protein